MPNLLPHASPSARRITLRNIVAAAGLVIASIVFARVAGLFPTREAAAPAQPVTLYDANPDHLWNRLHRALFVRKGKDGVEYGYDDTVPFNPANSETYLDGRAQKKAVAVLDEFLSKHGEGLVRDPLKRAVLQHDLWAAFDNELIVFPEPQRSRPLFGSLFDTSAVDRDHNQRELTSRLSRCIQRLALTGEEIKALPDNFAQAVKSGLYSAKYDPEHPEKPFLPPDLFDPKGPWIEIIFNTGQISHTPQVEYVTAPVHVQSCSGRSAFELFIRLPGGREETLAYLNKLNLFPTPWKFEPAGLIPSSGNTGNMRGDPLQFNPDTPQFPVGTMVALVRRMILVSDKIEPVPTSLIESVQLRVYCQVPGFNAQNCYEIDMRRAKLFSGESGGLHALEKGEKEPNILMGMGPKNLITDDCRECHSSSGIFSVQSYTRNLSRPVYSPQLPPASYPNASRDAVAGWKRGQSNWGLLTGLLDH